jgi:hypothetical protein
MAPLVFVLLLSVFYGASSWVSMKARCLPVRLTMAASIPAIVSFAIALWVGVEIRSAIDPEALAAHPHEHPASTALGIAAVAAGLGLPLALATHFVREPRDKTNP